MKYKMFNRISVDFFFLLFFFRHQKYKHAYLFNTSKYKRENTTLFFTSLWYDQFVIEIFHRMSMNIEIGRIWCVRFNEAIPFFCLIWLVCLLFWHFFCFFFFVLFYPKTTCNLILWNKFECIYLHLTSTYMIRIDEV